MLISARDESRGFDVATPLLLNFEFTEVKINEVSHFSPWGVEEWRREGVGQETEVVGEGISLSRLPDILYHENLVITKAEDNFISSSILSGLLCRTLPGQLKFLSIFHAGDIFS